MTESETTTASLARILCPDLADFAKELLAEGFKVYVFRSDVERVAKGGRESIAASLKFSRIVDGQECFGSVDVGLAGPQFHMPIKPSRENGSSMFIGGNRAREFDDLSIGNAMIYASPAAHNRLVGTQANYRDPVWQDRLYVEVTH